MADSSKKTPEGRFAGGSANYLLRHLIGTSTAIRRRIADELKARGHEPTFAVSQLIVNLPIDGLGMSDLASRLRLTLQRTGQLVAQLEEFGYVERVPDKRDGRAKRVEYTRRGRELLDDIDEIDTQMTRQIAGVLGARRFASLCRDLEALDDAFSGEGDVLRL